MGNDKDLKSKHQKWAEFRFSVVGRLLASPPGKGNLNEELKTLSEKTWQHPTNGNPTKFAFSTIEGWYYKARNEKMYPVDKLRKKIRSDKGCFRTLHSKIKDLINKQYQEHKSWSYKLHADNIKVLDDNAPSYSTIRRYMKGTGLFKKKKIKNKRKNLIIAEKVFESREVREFENEYVGGLWHLDYHHCSRKIITKKGEWVTPIALAILDDRSRLACHVQWYLAEDTKNLVHGFSQALQKRGMPREQMTDNGSAMMSQEFTQGLTRLGITHNTTLPYSPYQNGKQERFFGSLEGRLMAMIENRDDLTLKELNDYTLVWVEMEYNRTKHEEIKCAPIERFANDKSVSRPTPSHDDLKLFFCREETRLQRRTDGTISLEGMRYEVPGQYRHIEKIWIRYAIWDLSFVYMIDNNTNKLLARLYPQDKIKNSNQRRKPITTHKDLNKDIVPKDEIAPLLKKYLEEYKAKGLLMPYLPQDENL